MHRIVLIATCLLASVLLLFWQPRSRVYTSSVAFEPLSVASGAPTERSANTNPAWNAKAAADYLDQRASWWMSWSRSQRDHETFCISCHTAVPYAMARPALRRALGEQVPSPAEERLIANVTKRVRLWREAEPFYSDKDRGEYKTVESRGTEAVLNALVLASHDAQLSQLSDDAQLAFANMWAEQQSSGEEQGAWHWLRFKNEPWEADDSDFYGAALAAVATGITPGNYRLRPEIQPNLKLLKEYLNRKAPDEPLMNRVVLLWAAAKVPGLVEPELQRAVLREVFAKQQPDGGWNLPSIAGNWSRHDNTPQDLQGDGYATGLIVYVLEQLAPVQEPAKARTRLEGEAMPAAQRKPHLPSRSGSMEVDVSARLVSAKSWLASHQDSAAGYWPSASLNKNEANHISPETARFMNDAATAYAVLALNAGGE